LLARHPSKREHIGPIDPEIEGLPFLDRKVCRRFIRCKPFWLEV
jgi:hypothetical protein